MDRISKLPPGIIEGILCLVPIQEAARTSILSREWRYHWIKIPKVEFIENTFQVSTSVAKLSNYEQLFDINSPGYRKEMTKRCKIFYAIYQVLLVHQGPIYEFALSMRAGISCVEIDLIILHLSKRNTVKILKLDLRMLDYALPLSLFSLHQLTDLHLNDCVLGRHLSFNGLGSLTTLYLGRILTCEKTLLRLLSSCPLLKRLSLNCNYTGITFSGDSTVADLMECLLDIEYLCVLCSIILCFLPLPKEPPTTLVHLKYLCMEWVWLRNKYSLPFLVLLIRSSPNLEKLKLEMSDNSLLEYYEPGSVTLEDCSDIMLEHMKELEILKFSNTENELDFLKLILAKSPILKKVRIILSKRLGKDEELEILKILLSFPRASLGVKIIVRKLSSN